MIERLIAALRGLEHDLDWRDVADLLWLALQQTASPSGAADGPQHRPPADQAGPSPSTTASVDREVQTASDQKAASAPAAELTFTATSDVNTTGTRFDVRIPSVYALPGRLEIGRAMRPFKQYRRSNRDRAFDAEATIKHFCDTELLVPITAPVNERWFGDLALVADGSETMVVWEQTIDALHELLAHHGAFSRVSRWTLTGTDAAVQLTTPTGLRHGPSALVDFGARRLTMVLTDCLGSMWQSDAAWAALREWGRFTPVVIAQLLPPRLWPATALGEVDVVISAHRRGAPNRQLRLSVPWWWDEDGQPEHPIPVVTLDGASLGSFARMVMGDEGVEIVGVIADPWQRTAAELEPASAEPHARVASFRTTVSDQASRLATLLSAIEVTLPVARLLLDELIPHGSQVHLAEVLAGGLLSPPPAAEARSGVYAFGPGVREELQRSLTTTDTIEIWRAVAGYLEKATGDRPAFAELIKTQGRPTIDIAAAAASADADLVAEQLQTDVGGERPKAPPPPVAEEAPPHPPPSP